MKFLCVACDQAMTLENKTDSTDGTMAILFTCGACGNEIAMLTNPGETQLVHSLGVSIGHERIAPEPMNVIRDKLAHRDELVEDEEWEPVWTEAAERRLAAAPSFVQGMIRRLYTDYARRLGYREITPKIMNEAREALGMTGM